MFNSSTCRLVINALNHAGEFVHDTGVNIGSFIDRSVPLEVFQIALGAFGGYLSGGSIHKGGLQSLIGVSLGGRIIVPILTVIENNAGNGENHIHEKTVKVLRVLGLVTGITLPVLITKKYGDAIFATVGPYAPPWLQWLIPIDVSREQYTMARALTTEVSLGLAQMMLGEILREDPKEDVKKT